MNAPQVLTELYKTHRDLLAQATTPQQIGEAFAPLYVAGSLLNKKGDMAMPRDVARKLRSAARKVAAQSRDDVEAALANKLYTYADMLTSHGRGRPAGSAPNFETQVINALYPRLVNELELLGASNVAAVLIEPGSKPESCSGQRGKASPGAAFIEDVAQAGGLHFGVPLSKPKLRQAIRDLRKSARTRA